MNDLLAQVPQGINFSGSLISNSIPISNQTIDFEVKLSLEEGPSFIEAHTVSTGNLGEYAFVIGQGSLISGSFSDLNWHLGGLKITVKADLEDTGTMTQVACAPILSVPYAFYAERSGPVGSTGPEGPVGNQGSTGSTGPVGPGDISSYGFQGSTGNTGPTGNQGAIGLDGTAGLSCWDLNSSGYPDGLEDLNGDNLVNTLDCLYGSNWSSEGSNLILANGNLGIGIANPEEKLHVIGSICYTGINGSCSDLKFKRNIERLTNPLLKLEALEGVYYHWKVDDFKNQGFNKDRQLGLIAQDVEPILPEIVSINSNGYRTVDYERLSALLVESMKEEQKQLEKLILEYEALYESIESRMEFLENALSEEKINSK